MTFRHQKESTLSDSEKDLEPLSVIMWGNWKGNLEALGGQVAKTASTPGKGVNALLSRVVDVVAPPLDDEFYEDEEDAEFYDDDEVYDEDEEEEEGEDEEVIYEQPDDVEGEVEYLQDIENDIDLQNVDLEESELPDVAEGPKQSLFPKSRDVDNEYSARKHNYGTEHHLLSVISQDNESLPLDFKSVPESKIATTPTEENERKHQHVKEDEIGNLPQEMEPSNIIPKLLESSNTSKPNEILQSNAPSDEPGIPDSDQVNIGKADELAIEVIDANPIDILPTESVDTQDSLKHPSAIYFDKNIQELGTLQFLDQKEATVILISDYRNNVTTYEVTPNLETSSPSTKDSSSTKERNEPPLPPLPENTQENSTPEVDDVTMIDMSKQDDEFAYVSISNPEVNDRLSLEASVGEPTKKIKAIHSNSTEDLVLKKTEFLSTDAPVSASFSNAISLAAESPLLVNSSEPIQEKNQSKHELVHKPNVPAKDDYTTSLEMQVVQLQKQLQESQHQLSKESLLLQNDLSQSKVQIASLQQELHQSNKQFHIKQQMMKERDQQMEFQLKEYIAECEILRQEKESLEVTVQNQQSSEQDKAKQQSQLRRLLEETQQKAYQYEKQLDQQATEMQQLQKVVKNMSANVKAATERATKAEELVKSLRLERDELEKEIHEELDHKEELEDELNELKSKTSLIASLEVRHRPPVVHFSFMIACSHSFINLPDGVASSQRGT